MPSLAVVVVGVPTTTMLLRLHDLNPHEIVVVGEWHPHPWVRYVEVRQQGPPSVMARLQREVAVNVTQSTHLLFLDGWMTMPGWHKVARYLWHPTEVVVPRRVDGLGFADPWGTIPRGALYRRDLLRRVPFGAAYPGPRWEHWHTEACRVAGADFQVVDDLWLERTRPTGVTRPTVRYRKGLRAAWREPPTPRWTDPTLPASPSRGSLSWSAVCARLLTPTRFSKPGAFSDTPPPTSLSASKTEAGDA